MCHLVPVPALIGLAFDEGSNKTSVKRISTKRCRPLANNLAYELRFCGLMALGRSKSSRRARDLPVALYVGPFDDERTGCKGRDMLVPSRQPQDTPVSFESSARQVCCAAALQVESREPARDEIF